MTITGPNPAAAPRPLRIDFSPMPGERNINLPTPNTRPNIHTYSPEAELHPDEVAHMPKPHGPRGLPLHDADNRASCTMHQHLGSIACVREGLEWYFISTLLASSSFLFDGASIKWSYTCLGVCFFPHDQHYQASCTYHVYYSAYFYHRIICEVWPVAGYSVLGDQLWISGACAGFDDGGLMNARGDVITSASDKSKSVCDNY
ncbi:hypothetical protein GQ44DRAFT_723506 [Phaeosphaeriaceae sp. PMI808]|nr:hypothetical protein GQ44DRAFT_723506 [Phaeosphaeriaceae sp. PMI808]